MASERLREAQIDEGYRAGLKQGQGRGEALQAREVRDDATARDGASVPLAGFIQSGEWTELYDRR